MLTTVDEFKRVLAVMCHPVGGIRTYFRYNYPELARAGYQFTFVAPAGQSFDDFQLEFASWPGIEFVGAPSTKNRPHLWRTVRRLLRGKRFSLIHSNGITAGVHCTVANIGIACPHILTVHGVLTANDLAGTMARPSRWLLGELLRRVDMIVMPSEDARDNHYNFLPQLVRGPCRVDTIPHGIDINAFSGNTHGIVKSTLRKRLAIGGEVFLIGFLGRFMEEKGFLVLLDAIEQLVSQGTSKPFQVVAVGSGDYEVNYRAETLRRKMVADRVTFLESVRDVVPILAQLDVVVMPSLWEACGLLAIEAMCMGVPLIGSDCIGLREVLRGTPSRMVATNDAATLANALREAMRNPWTDEACAYAPTARNRFDVTIAAKALLSHFDALATRERKKHIALTRLFAN